MAKKLQPVPFVFSASEEVREAEIRVEGFAPFTIRFRVPNGITRIGGRMRMSSAETAEARGEAAVRQCAEHLVSWSLEPKPDFDGLAALAKGCEAAFWEIAATIAKAGRERKN